MPRPRVPDTTELIRLIRDPDSRALSSFIRDVRIGRLYLSSVVICELYAGTRSAEEAEIVEDIAVTATQIGRLLVPTADEWIIAGQLIGRRVRLHGVVEPRDHLTDALIVLSAARLQGEVVSANTRHMRVWVELAQRAGLDVELAP